MASLRDVIVHAEPPGSLLPLEEGSLLEWKVDPSSTNRGKQKDGDS